MSFLPTIGPLDSLIVIQTSLATPWLPFLHALLASNPTVVICVGILHPPAILLPAALKVNAQRVLEIDWTKIVPKYQDAEVDGTREDLHNAVLRALANVPAGPVTLVVDSPDTLRADLDSASAAYNYLQAWYTAMTSRHSPSRMILPLPAHSPLLPRVLTTAFSPPLVHLTLHPPKLLHHLATAHLAPAPPHPRFWALLSSALADGQAEQLVWGNGGQGWTNAETIVEVFVRRPRGRRIERTIEAWRSTGPCELTELTELRGLWSDRLQARSGYQPVDPTHGVSFNLVLTDEQRHARAQVPLPYVHSGDNSARTDVIPSLSAGAILYDPDSADDLDDDDPDEDLDI